MKNFIKALIFSLIFVSIFPVAQAVYTAPGIQITNLAITPNPVDFRQNPSVTISYNTNAEATVTLVILQGTKKVGTFVNNQLLGIGAHAYYWNGKYGTDTQVGTSGQLVTNGIYSFTITAVNTGEVAQGVATQAVKTGTVTVANTTQDSGGLEITDVDINNEIFDPWAGQTTTITFEINDDADVTIEIEDEDEDLVKTLKDDESYDEGSHSVTWNGKNSSGSTVADGDYTYIIHAETLLQHDDVEGIVAVEKNYVKDNTSDDPNIENTYITKESFDPEWEYTYIVFNLTARADIKVAIYDDNDDLVETLYDEDNRPNGLYKIKWDGEDVDENDYTYKISVENDEGKDSATGNVEVKEDSVTENTPNIYKDKIDIDLIPYSTGSGNLTISFKIDDDAEVTAEIRQDNKLIKKISDEEELNEGSNALQWDGKNKSGSYVNTGIYEYKIIAQNSHGTDTERGNFSVIKTTAPVSGTCAGFTDIPITYKYCEAVAWAKDEGIFSGYGDNTFKPYQAIRRSEILKVVMEAFDINLIGTNGGNMGFSDIEGQEWFISYLATSLSLGIVKGYDDHTFKPYDSVTRTQALKIMLEAAKDAFNLSIPNNNFGKPYKDIQSGQWYTKYAWIAQENHLTDNENYFYPYGAMTRGEMADMLHRFHEAELDQ